MNVISRSTMMFKSPHGDEAENFVACGSGFGKKHRAISHLAAFAWIDTAAVQWPYHAWS